MRRAMRIRQRDITDCGAACLASIAAYHGLQWPVSRIRQYAGTDKNGTSVGGLLEAAGQMGMDAKAGKAGIESLPRIPLPAIAHMVLKNGLQHYVVICRVKKRFINIMDPADGRIHRYKQAAFAKEWTGVLVLLAPAVAFRPRQAVATPVARFWQLVAPHRYSMLLALTGALVVTLLSLSTSVYMQKVIDVVLVEDNIKLLNLMSILMVGLLLFQLFIGMFKALLGLQVGQHIDVQLLLGYYKHLLRLPQRFFDTMRVGEIISRVNDAVKIRHFVNEVALNTIVNLSMLLFSFMVMFFYYWKLAVIVLAVLPCYLLLYKITDNINRVWQRRLMENAASLESQLVESLNAAATIKQFGLEYQAGVKTEHRFIALLRSVYFSSKKGLYSGTASALFTRLLGIIILWTGGYFVIRKELTPGELVSFYALAEYFTTPAAALIGSNKDIREALIAADRLFEIIDLETEEGTKAGKILLEPVHMGDIVFQDVHFRYGTREQVFEGLNLCIRKGSCTAIVGESGSGKSTLLALLQQLYPLSKGKIYIGGIDITLVSRESQRKLIAPVPQETDLFAGTIAENIGIGDEHPDNRKILFLSRLLGLDAFIEQLPAGYNSQVQEQGNNLSGGQKQRLSIARALYRDPEILVLDEATASLDSQSEQKVQEALQWFRSRGKTVIVIAHRLATIRNCDCIHVLHKGKLLETGTHDQLMQQNGAYVRLWQP